MSPSPLPPSSPTVWIAAGVGVAILVVAAGVVALTSGPHPAGAGALLNIAVVAPPEHEVAPGGILDVGQLTDGYVHTDPAPRPAPQIIDAYLPEEDVSQPIAAPTRSRRLMDGAMPYSPIADDDTAPVASARETVEENPLSFGFDALRPDYAAERAARRARLDALDALAREASARATTAGDAATAPDTFY